MAVPTCPTCRGPMRKATQSRGNVTGIILALIVFVVGVVLIFALPCVGWVLGPLLMLLALGMGGKRSKVWRCKSCKVIVPRG